MTIQNIYRYTDKNIQLTAKRTTSVEVARKENKCPLCTAECLYVQAQV